MTILITGANRGIGQELARQYAAAGKTVIATTRGDVPADLKGVIEWITLDVTSPDSFKALAKALGARPISLLICNAGVNLGRNDKLASGFPPQDWAATFAVNVAGPFQTIQTVLPNLEAAAPAKIAIISSTLGSNTLASGGAYVYRASKAAATNLASNLALDLVASAISVGSYHPGWVKTDMGGSAAEIDVKTSAQGLIARFEALSPETSGCFEAYDGTTLPF